jgi:hypothetical protein
MTSETTRRNNDKGTQKKTVPKLETPPIIKDTILQGRHKHDNILNYKNEITL